MDWTLANLRRADRTPEFLGAHAAATVAHEHKFGLIGHSLVGLLGGALSGYFLQVMAMTVVTGSGSLTAPRAADMFVSQALAGAIAGAIGVFVVGFAIHLRSNAARK